MGGPKLMAETVRQLTGLPVDFYVLTAFEGFQKIVDEVGGVNVQVDQKMNDKYSGARFDPGWHNMNGGQALAYSRDRHDVANGDFTRSLHQGNVMMSALAKLRAEVGDDAGLQRWIGVLLRHADLDSPPQQLLPLAALARRLDPAKITNVVAPRPGGHGRQRLGRLPDRRGPQAVPRPPARRRHRRPDRRPAPAGGHHDHHDGAALDDDHQAPAATDDDDVDGPVHDSCRTTHGRAHGLLR